MNRVLQTGQWWLTTRAVLSIRCAYSLRKKSPNHLIFLLILKQNAFTSQVCTPDHCPSCLCEPFFLPVIEKKILLFLTPTTGLCPHCQSYFSHLPFHLWKHHHGPTSGWAPSCTFCAPLPPRLDEVRTVWMLWASVGISVKRQDTNRKRSSKQKLRYEELVETTQQFSDRAILEQDNSLDIHLRMGRSQSRADKRWLTLQNLND